MSDDFVNTMQNWLDLTLRLSMRDLWQFSQSEGYSFSQMNTLIFIHRQKRVTINSLSHHLGVTTAAVSQLIERMVGMNLVSRQVDPADRRNRLLTLTELGGDKVKEFKAARMHWLRVFDQNLTPAEKEQITPLIALMLERLPLAEAASQAHVHPNSEE